MDKIAEIYNAYFQAGYADYINSINAPVRIKTASLSEAEMLANTLAESRALPAPKPARFYAANPFVSAGGSLSEVLDSATQAEASGRVPVSSASRGVSRALPAELQAPVSVSGAQNRANLRPMTEVGSLPAKPAVSLPVSATQIGAGAHVPAPAAVPEAEAAASRLSKLIPKTRLGKAGLGVAGLGALGLGANYLMGEDEPASFSDRLMSGDLSPEEMAALGLGGAALGTGAYYAADQLL